MVKTDQQDVKLKLNIAFKGVHLKKILSTFGHKTNGSKDDLVNRLYRLVCSKNKVKNAEKIKNSMREIYTENLNKNPQLKCKIKEMQMKLKEKEKARDRRRNRHLEDSSDDSQSSSSSKRSQDNSDGSFSNKNRRRIRVISSDSSDNESLRMTITNTKSNSNASDRANENQSMEVTPDDNSSEDEIIFVCEKKQDKVNQASTSQPTPQTTTSQTIESDPLVNTNTNLEKSGENLREKINLHLQGISNLQLTKDILARIPNTNRMNFSFLNPTANQTITTAASASSNSTTSQNSNQTMNFSFLNPTMNQRATTSSTRTSPRVLFSNDLGINQRSVTCSTSTTCVASNLLSNLANSVPTCTQTPATNFSFRIPHLTTTATTSSNLARNENSTIPRIMLFRDLRTNQISIATSSTSTTRMTSNNSSTNLFPRLSSYNANSSTINNSYANVGTDESITNQKPEENHQINFNSTKSLYSPLKCKKITMNHLDSGELTYKVLIQDREVSLTKVKQRLNNTSSSEIEVETNDLKLLLICPITNKRIKIPIRSLRCSHLECFDAEAFFSLNYKKLGETWKCPKCMQSARLSELIFDELLKEILYKTEEDCQAVVFNKDGTWTPKIINGNDEMKTSQEKIVEEIQIDDDDDDDDDKKKELQTAKQRDKENKNNEKVKIEPTNSSKDNNNTTVKDKSLNTLIAQAQAHKNLKRKYNYHKIGEPSTHGDWFVPSQTRSIANTQPNLRSSSSVNSIPNNSQPNHQGQNQFHNAYYQHSQPNYRSHYPQVRYSNQQTQDYRPSSAYQVYQYQQQNCQQKPYQQQPYQQQPYQQQNCQQQPYQQQPYQQQNYHQQRQKFSNQFQNERNPAVHNFNNYYQQNYSFNQNLPYDRLIEFSNQQFNADYNSLNSSEQDNLSSRNYQYQINTNQYSNRFSGNIANNNYHYQHQTSERQNIRLNKEQTTQNELNFPDLSFVKDKHIKYETITIMKLNGQKKQTYKIVCDLCKCDLSLPQDFKIDAYKKNIIEHVNGQRHKSYLRQTYSNHNLNSCIGGSGPTN